MENETIVTQEAENTTLPTAEEATVSQEEVADPGGTLGEVKTAFESYRTHTAKQEDNSVSDSSKTEGEETQDAKTLKKAEFEKLIKGDYKEFYEERIKENLSRRFKENSIKNRENSLNSEIVDMLYEKYNVDTGDFKNLKKAIEADNAYLADEARKRGMSVEDYKYVRRLENENKNYRMRSAKYEAMNKANRTLEKWYAQSEEVKETYPHFDIAKESKNKAFVNLIKSGIDVKTAYEVVHHDEIISMIAKDAEIKTAESIRQRSLRPAENGLSSQSSAILKNDVSKLSVSERAEIARRVSRGERITF